MDNHIAGKRLPLASAHHCIADSWLHREPEKTMGLVLAQMVVVMPAWPMYLTMSDLSVPLPPVLYHRARANRAACYTDSPHAQAWEAVAWVTLLIHLVGLG